MPEIVQGALGPEASYDLSFSGGKLVISLKYGGEQADVSVSASVSAAQLVAALAAKLSNPTEKAILMGLEAVIAAIP